MESLVITPRDKQEMKFVSELLSKIGLNTLKLSEEEKEDLGLARLMLKADRTKIIPLDEFKKSLMR